MGRRADTEAASDLKKFFGGVELVGGAMGYHEFRGFLFAVVAAPGMVPPSEWLPLAFGEQGPDFNSTAQAKRIIGAIMTLFNEISTGISEGTVRLPADCQFRDEVLSNLSDDAPVSQWSRGFMRGHTWLRESWDAHLSGDSKNGFAAMVMALSFFSSRRLAERVLAECTKGDPTLVDLAEAMRSGFPAAMVDYAKLGMSIHRTLLAREPAKPRGVGRNAPCSCGSGRKSKRCCGQ